MAESVLYVLGALFFATTVFIAIDVWRRNRRAAPNLPISLATRGAWTARPNLPPLVNGRCEWCGLLERACGCVPFPVFPALRRPKAGRLPSISDADAQEVPPPVLPKDSTPRGAA